MSQNDDLISRQEVVDAYGDWYVEEGTAEGFIGTVKQLLEGLPPAQSEQKVGHWILHPEWEIDGECSATCSECEMGVDVLYNFCPRCGAKMERRTDA